MTSRELTSGFDFWSRGHLRMAVMHLNSHKIWCIISLFSPELLTFFRNLRWRQPPSWIFRLCEFGHSGMLIVWYLCSVQNLVQILLLSLRSTHLSFRPSFDDITRINFRFRLLVTWSSPHGRDGSSHKIWYRYLYLIRSYWHFTEIKDGDLGFVGGTMRPPTKAYLWSVLPVNISSWSAK